MLPVLNFLFQVHVMVGKCLMSTDNVYVDNPRLRISHKYILIFSITQNTLRIGKAISTCN